MAEDWNARADREAAAILAVRGPFADDQYTGLVMMLALAYKEGAMAGLTRAMELIDMSHTRRFTTAPPSSRCPTPPPIRTPRRSR